MVARIHIMGASGSGKTTLANQLSETLGIPWYELDSVAYEGGFARKRTYEERMASLHAIIDQPDWITEGFYLWWIDDLLDAADAIVWLDLPWHVSMPRIVTRHIHLSWIGENRHPGLRNLANYAWGCRHFYLESEPRVPESLDDDGAVNRAGVVNYLAPYADKVVHCRHPNDVAEFFEQITANL
jgi:adenylate kinase family enzyme